MSYARGRWQRIERVAEAMPWLRYVATLDDRTRPEHRAWHGTVLRYDDPFWATHYPPNGWRCRCSVVQLADADLKRYGWSPSEGPPPGAGETRPWLNKRTGRIVQVPRGIDPGFEHNAGTIGRAEFIKPPEVEAKAKAAAKAIGADDATQADPFAIPDVMRRAPGDTAPAAPGAPKAHTDRPAVTSETFRRCRDYRPASDLPGRAADYYSDDWYGPLNRAMRDGDALVGRGKRIRDDMVSAMRETTEELEVWRGRKSSIGHALDEEITDQAFSSWSESWRTAQNFAGAVGTRAGETAPGTIYRVRLPRGTRAVVENEREQEVLLGPGAKFRVAEIIDNAENGADPLYRGPSRVYILEVVDKGAN